MGVLHTRYNLFFIVGKRSQDTRLRDLCVGAGVIAEGSVNAEMEGCKYNRTVRLHKPVYEPPPKLACKILSELAK